MSLPLSPIVCLAARPANKEAAIRMAGQLLLEAGCIAPEYIESLLQREAIADTYLGSGVAIPHGLLQDRGQIRKTGVAVLQVPQGVTWNEGQTARLVVAIAAQSDEHIDLLRRLTRLMGQAELLERLCVTDDPQAIVAQLADAAQVAVAQPAASFSGQSIQVMVDYPNGLHARPATAWVGAAKRFAAQIRIYNGVECGDAKSMVGLLSLGIKAGQQIRIEAEGGDAEAALAAMAEVIAAQREQEIADALAQARRTARKSSWMPQANCDVIRGVAASPGLTIGITRQHAPQAIIVKDEPVGANPDGDLLDAAVLAVRAELAALAESTAQRLGAGQAAIFLAQAELLIDPALLRRAASGILAGHGAAWAWRQAFDAEADALAGHADPLLAARAADVRDVGLRVLRHLLGLHQAGEAYAEGTILLADDLMPSDTVGLDTTRVVALATVVGGPTSHTAILARTLGIPALVAGGARLAAVPDGTVAVLDGDAGNLYLNPASSDLEAARAAADAVRHQREQAAAMRDLPAVTQDGFRVEIAANITSAKQAGAALEGGAEGVGLMRTEFLFMDRATPPDEEEQYRTYCEILDVMAGRPVIIRALDIGGDKEVPYLNLPAETNPFLGVRGLRLLLRRPDLLETQLRALYRASSHGALSIMFPMVTDVAEVVRVREIAEAIRSELGVAPVPLGIMVEVPSVAALAGAFARHVDFFSIGTNDLTQYTLAVDRQHPELAAMANSLHPAVLRLIEQTVRGAREHDVWVGVCGGLAGDPLGAAILAGLGVNELSMTASDIPAIKAALRAGHHADMQALAQKALACVSLDEVRALGASA